MSAESDDPPAIVASRERPCSSCASALLLDPGGVAIRPAVGSLRNVPDHDRRDELWLHHVSSFSTGTLKGNQAGVVILPGTADAAWMQAVARSAGHAATAFVIRLSTEEFEMRWFSPSAELELCGHGTLAAVHVLAEQGDTGPWLFSTRAGPVTAARRRGTLMVRFDPIELAPAELPGELAAALPPVVRVARGLDHIVELADASGQRHRAAISRLSNGSTRADSSSRRVPTATMARLTSCRGSFHRRQVSRKTPPPDRPMSNSCASGTAAG